MISHSTLRTTQLGDLLLVADADRLAGVYFADRDHAPTPGDDWRPAESHPVLDRAADQIRSYLDGHLRDFSIALGAAGTPFQREVWRQIARVGFGQTITYTELAERAGAPGAVRAVGTATGRNPISIVVPCHRVVGKDGALTGYAGAIERKQHLLRIEGRGGSTGQMGLRFGALVGD